MVLISNIFKVKITCKAEHFMEHLNEAMNIEHADVEAEEFEFNVKNYVR